MNIKVNPHNVISSVPRPVNLYRSFLTIWIHPRQTINLIADNDPNFFTKRGIALIAVFFNLEFLWSNTVRQIFGSLEFILDWVLIYLLGSVVAWIGYKMGGKAESNLVRTAIVWAFVPSVVGSLFLIVPIIIRDPVVEIIAYTFILLSVIWTLVLGVIFVSEVQEFSIWKALVSLLSGSVIFYAVNYLITYLLNTLSGSS